MSENVKKQIEAEILKCDRRIKWGWGSIHYWRERRAILMNSLHYGLDVALKDVQKTLTTSSKYLADIVKANQDTLLDIQTKWSK
ncbi:hypothetical protein [Runella zeae]|uniref:hypothetical protein n=1 Tax=Runella zeae TaxID=94255 RepID=UPI0023528B18|nr:hypothetical protein [Runella zeae]